MPGWRPCWRGRGMGRSTAVAGAGDEQLLAIDGVSEKALRQIREKVPAVGLRPARWDVTAKRHIES